MEAFLHLLVCYDILQNLPNNIPPKIILLPMQLFTLTKTLATWLYLSLSGKSNLPRDHLK